jgi:hypothetical protein
MPPRRCRARSAATFTPPTGSEPSGRPTQRPGAGPKQDVGAPLVADLQPPAAHQPRQRPPDHVAVTAELIARLDAAAGDARGDAAAAQRPAAAGAVVGLVQVELVGPPPWPPWLSPTPLDRRHRIATTASSSIESWVLAADRQAARGCPSDRPAGGTWTRVCRGLSGSGRSGSPPFGPHAHAVQASVGPVQPALAAQLLHQRAVQPPPVLRQDDRPTAGPPRHAPAARQPRQRVGRSVASVAPLRTSWVQAGLRRMNAPESGSACGTRRAKPMKRLYGAVGNTSSHQRRTFVLHLRSDSTAGRSRGFQRKRSQQKTPN